MRTYGAYLFNYKNSTEPYLWSMYVIENAAFYYYKLWLVHTYGAYMFNSKNSTGPYLRSMYVTENATKPKMLLVPLNKYVSGER